jgi:hypothetical protein
MLNLKRIPSICLDERTLAKLEMLGFGDRTGCDAVEFEGGDAIYQPNVMPSGVVTVRFGSVVRTHYDFESIASCLRAVYGL